MRFFLLDHFSRHPWGCVEALKPFLGPFFSRKLLINMLVTLIGENSASESDVWTYILGALLNNGFFTGEKKVDLKT